MAHPKIADQYAIVEALAKFGCDFIVIGGAAALLHGSPQGTFDVDIVRSRTPQNIEKLLRLLADLDAYTRLDSRQLRFGESHLAGAGALLTATRLGPLDLLGAVADGRGYDELLPHTELFDIGGYPVRVLDLPTLIEVKSAAGRDKDKLAVAHLSLILAERNRQPQ
jgi:hypothetical protein